MENVSGIWIVGNTTHVVYQHTFADSARPAVNRPPQASLLPDSTNPQGIADPPAEGTAIATISPSSTDPAPYPPDRLYQAAAFAEALAGHQIPWTRKSHSKVRA